MSQAGYCMRLDSQRLFSPRTIDSGLLCTSVGEEDEGVNDGCEWNGGSAVQERTFNCRLLEGEKTRRELMELLNSRHDQSVPFIVRLGICVKHEVVQLPSLNDIYRAHDDFRTCFHLPNDFIEENLIVQTEAGEQGKVPLLIIKRSGLVNQQKQGKCRGSPAIIMLHSSYKSKECLRALLQSYATRGYIAIGIDSRHHGQRATSKMAYSNAMISAWRKEENMPFIFDTAWDLVKVMDYLNTREDIDPKRIGIMGISLGGMHAWFAAALEPRFAVVVPIIGVQNFGWAINNDKWHARVASIPHAFEVAAKDLNKDIIDSKVVFAVLQKIAPGLLEKFDAHCTLPAIAPRPLLILNGKDDLRCPVEGLAYTIHKTENIYSDCGFPQNFKFIAEPGIGHHLSPSMLHEARCWFDKFLEPELPQE